MRSTAGAESLIYPLDLRDPRSPEVVVKGTLERFGRVDALVNIAGAVPQIDLFEMTDAQWDDGMALKLHGARRLTVQAWDALKSSNGSVILISGSAAWIRSQASRPWQRSSPWRRPLPNKALKMGFRSTV
jgi:3-oxoacyl-[acyl-carrier protein] reductase